MRVIRPKSTVLSIPQGTWLCGAGSRPGVTDQPHCALSLPVRLPRVPLMWPGHGAPGSPLHRHRLEQEDQTTPKQHVEAPERGRWHENGAGKGGFHRLTAHAPGQGKSLAPAD